jgi:glycosyltransferase involved in cell wall biosynthesis
MPSQRRRVDRSGASRRSRRGRPPRIVWVVDWSDREQTDFVGAFAELGYEQQIIRSRHTGLTVGTRWHRLNSYPAYAYLALRALLARADVVVAWQPIVASLLGYIPFRPPVVAIEPVLIENDRRLVGRFSLRALRRIEKLVMCTQGLADRFLERGFSTERVVVIERGVPFRDARNGPGCEYLFAGGREHRDWITLREAAAGIELPVRLGAPNSPADGGSLQLLPPLSRVDYVEQLRGARALVVPLKDNTRGAGVLTILEAYSYGVPVIATSNVAIDDYVIDGAGVLVDPGDVDGLTRAMKELSDEDTATLASCAATDLVRDRLSLTRFVGAVQDVACESAGDSNGRQARSH